MPQGMGPCAWRSLRTARGHFDAAVGMGPAHSATCELRAYSAYCPHTHHPAWQFTKITIDMSDYPGLLRSVAWVLSGVCACACGCVWVRVVQGGKNMCGIYGVSRT